MLDGGGVSASIPTETIHVDDPVVACDGGVGALGHPRVWLRTVPVVDGPPGTLPQVVCPYCSRLYILNDGAGSDHGH